MQAKHNPGVETGPGPPSDNRESSCPLKGVRLGQPRKGRVHHQQDPNESPQRGIHLQSTSLDTQGPKLTSLLFAPVHC